MTNDNRRFQRGSGVYTCNCCKQQTRRTSNSGAAGIELCEECFDVAGLVNTMLDEPSLENLNTLSKSVAACYLKRHCESCKQDLDEAIRSWEKKSQPVTKKAGTMNGKLRLTMTDEDGNIVGVIEHVEDYFDANGTMCRRQLELQNALEEIVQSHIEGENGGMVGNDRIVNLIEASDENIIY